MPFTAFSKTNEIQGSPTYVCSGTNGTDGSNGTNGLNALIHVSAEPAGGNCASGGQRVDAGVDTSGNGVLDPSEITETAYVCNPTTAADFARSAVSAAAEEGPSLATRA